MSVKQVTRWQTTNGCLFASKEEAIQKDIEYRIQDLADACTFEGEFSCDSFLSKLKVSKELAKDFIVLLELYHEST